jgi:hypothetical protein
MVWVTVSHDGHRQLDPSSLIPEQEVQHHLLDRTGAGAREGHILRYGVALAQPVRHLGDEVSQGACSLNLAYARIVQNRLSSKGAYQRVRFVGHDPLIVGDSVVGVRLILYAFCASSFGCGGGKDLWHPGHQNLFL